MKANIEIDNILYEVQYIIEPEEKQVRHYGDGSGYPGSPSNIILEYVFIKSGPDIGEQVDDEDIIERISDKLNETGLLYG